MRPELPTASAGSSQAPTAAVDNSAPVKRLEHSTFKSGTTVQTNSATSQVETKFKENIPDQWSKRYLIFQFEIFRVQTMHARPFCISVQSIIHGGRCSTENQPSMQGAHLLHLGSSFLQSVACWVLQICSLNTPWIGPCGSSTPFPCARHLL